MLKQSVLMKGIVCARFFISGAVSDMPGTENAFEFRNFRFLFGLRLLSLDLLPLFYSGRVSQ